MRDDIDFADLYDELKLPADCPVSHLKQAYRRRVRELHPDLPGAVGDIEQLQKLNRMYTAALGFERRHGRLPGSLPRAAALATPARAPEQAAPLHVANPLAPMPAPAPELSASRPWLRYLLLPGVVALVLFWLAPRDQAEPEMHTAALAPPPAAQVAAATTFGLGSDRTLVHRLQGVPFNDDETHWSYGPSWIEFRCGKVSDWYSSPLHPLRVRKARPDPAEALAVRQEGPPRC